MDDNMKVYQAVRKCPQNALRSIQAGRLKGKSDINPMWRIKKADGVVRSCRNRMVLRYYKAVA